MWLETERFLSPHWSTKGSPHAEKVYGLKNTGFPAAIVPEEHIYPTQLFQPNLGKVSNPSDLKLLERHCYGLSEVEMGALSQRANTRYSRIGITT